LRKSAGSPPSSKTTFVADLEQLSDLEARAAQLRAIVDGYGRQPGRCEGLVCLLLDFILAKVAWEADDVRVGPGAAERPIGFER